MAKRGKTTKPVSRPSGEILQHPTHLHQLRSDNSFMAAELTNKAHSYPLRPPLRGDQRSRNENPGWLVGPSRASQAKPPRQSGKKAENLSLSDIRQIDSQTWITDLVTDFGVERRVAGKLLQHPKSLARFADATDVEPSQLVRDRNALIGFLAAICQNNKQLATYLQRWCLQILKKKPGRKPNMVGGIPRMFAIAKRVDELKQAKKLKQSKPRQATKRELRSGDIYATVAAEFGITKSNVDVTYRRHKRALAQSDITKG